jgi:hypothetical protein
MPKRHRSDEEREFLFWCLVAAAVLLAFYLKG